MARHYTQRRTLTRAGISLTSHQSAVNLTVASQSPVSPPCRPRIARSLLKHTGSRIDAIQWHAVSQNVPLWVANDTKQ